ncbi:MAG: twin-arginine translocation signal domain-containing protein [Planctomycetaceae bacterium]
MSRPNQSRRHFLKSASAVAAATASTPFWFSTARSFADDAAAAGPNARLRLGCIGTGDRWKAVGPAAMGFADCLAVCDVDSNHAAEGKQIATDRNSKRGERRCRRV